MTKIRYMCLVLFLMIMIAQATDSTNYVSEKRWGVGMALRLASIPYETNLARSVSTVMPMIFYQGEHFFFNGFGGGYKFYLQNTLSLSAVARVHFFDIPEEIQNQVQGDNVDWGLQLRYRPVTWSYIDLELMLDWWQNFHANLFLQTELFLDNFEFRPFFQIKYKSADYNSTYYGLNQMHVSGGVTFSVGYRAAFQIYKNIYLFNAGRLNFLDRYSRNLSSIEDNITGEFILGAGFSNDRTLARKKKLDTKRYIRLAHGRASNADWIPLIFFQTDPDSLNNQMTSVFYGHPLADQLIGLPIQVYLTTGFAWHWKSSVQPNSQEIILGVKFHLTIPWPFRWRFGFVEGLSYINRITYIEQREMDRKNYQASNLLNYLDYTLDIDLGYFLGGTFFEDLWLGYSVHHRSGIYGTAQQFGRINGGSNYPSIYLQKHF
jgi:MipA family protein